MLILTPYKGSIAQAKSLMEIEMLVKNIIEHFKLTDPLFSISSEQDEFDEVFLNNLALNLMRYLQVFDEHCEYSFHLDLFWQACNLISLLRIDKLMIKQDYTSVLVELRQMKALVITIAHLAKSDPFKRNHSDLKYKMKQNNLHMIQYAQALHKRYARLLVIRIDFGYLSESMSQIDIKTFYLHQKQLAKRIETDKLFTHLAGHARSLEQGSERGYHCHAVFYFKGDKHQKDFYLVERIRAIWTEITKEHGTIYSSNLDKKRLKERDILGVGMIHRNQPDEVQKAVSAVSYLTRPDKDQHLRIRPKGKRIFIKGSLKKVRCRKSAKIKGSPD